jgi:hypothetical protein
MPPKKTKPKNEPIPINEEDFVNHIDVIYNPDIINGLLQELGSHVEAKCHKIKNDTDFMIAKLKQIFGQECVKIPTQIKQMSLKKFQQQYGDSITNVASSKSKIKPQAQQQNSNRASSKLMTMTPAVGKKLKVPLRAPREGEDILSSNGSPLGEFSTVVKQPHSTSIIPQTPGVFVPLNNGEIVDIESVAVEELSQEAKDEALEKMQIMMENMQNIINKLKAESP